MRMRTLSAFVLAYLVASVAGAAGNPCEVLLESTDDMRYTQGNGKVTVKEISVPRSCAEVKVTLRHIGSLPKAIMGHNFILTPELGWQEVAKAGSAAGEAKEFIPADPRVLAASKLIGGREQTVVVIPLSKLKDDAYRFFCSFPGHWNVMTGRLLITK